MVIDNLKNPSRYPALVVLILLGCIDTYDTNFTFLGNDTLVVEGFLNATEKAITVKLTRTQPVEGAGPPPSVAGATITVTGSAGSEFKLAEENAGFYHLTNINVSYSEKYQLNIATPDGREFSSDPVAVRRTPPLDSISYWINSDRTGIDLAVNARDASGVSKYFSWEFIETYEYFTPHRSSLIYDTPRPKYRTAEQDIYRCWRTIPSYSIGIATTTDLSSSVIHQKPILHIERGSIKLLERYSILVRQRVIGEEEYEYLRQLKQTTEGLGGIFGPIPAPVRGNLHRVDEPGTTVLGYFSASEVSQTRKFISRAELPDDFKIRLRACELLITCPPEREQGGNAMGPSSGFCDGPLELMAPGSNYILLYPSGIGETYVFTTMECADCTRQGGVTTPPDFW